MTETIRPADEAELGAAIGEALATKSPLEIVGNGTKRALGRPVQAARTLDLSRLDGITLYEPEELVLRAGAGTRLGDIAAALRAARQMLAFEPPDLAPLLGAGAREPSIGGVIACNLSGPRRIKAGAARDHFLGVRAVSGRAEAFKSGGRVVKNVTGYDLCKLLAGSYGTLAAMTEVTLKVLPAPEKTRSVLVFGLDDARAVIALGEAMASPHDVSAAAHLPRAAAALSQVGYVAKAGAAVTAVRVEGMESSVEARCAALRAILGGFGPVEELHSMNSEKLWCEIGAVAPLHPETALGQGRLIWRLSLPPSAGAATVAAIARSVNAHAIYDWAGGLVWLAVAGAPDGAAAAIRSAVRASGGHATLIRAAEPVRAALAVFDPEPPPLAALTRRIKEAFDPAGILNPGRMHEGI